MTEDEEFEALEQRLNMKETKQPEALRLADALGYAPKWQQLQAATELRRLYWEELRVREHRDQMCSEVTRLHEVNQESLTLLKEARKIIRASSQRNLVKDWDRRATAALAKAQGAQT